MSAMTHVFDLEILNPTFPRSERQVMFCCFQGQYFGIIPDLAASNRSRRLTQRLGMPSMIETVIRVQWLVLFTLQRRVGEMGPGTATRAVARAH